MTDELLPWWKTAVCYQIYPRSFATTGSGAPDPSGVSVGDLAGIRARLDHLVRLGVDAIWLSPFFRSPMKDFGYDISDYCDVDPLFGDARRPRPPRRRLPRARHPGAGRPGAQPHVRPAPVVRGLPLVAGRPERATGTSGATRRPTAARPTTGWRRSVPEPAWTFDEATGQYYLRLFLPEQPDLNWANPEVEAAMHDVVRFWLDRGVDGFRVDVVHLIGKDPELADDPADVAGIPHVALNDRPETHALLRRLRAVLDSYPGERMMVGEVYLLDTRRVAAYYGDGDELHLSFNFPPLYAPWDAARWREQIENTAATLAPVDAWPTWVLSNHDNPRHRTRYGSEARARAAAMLLLGLRGTPFLYAGEELGLGDAEVPPERVVDPGGRDGCRAPIPWDPTHGHGWPGEPWLPFPPEADTHSVADQWADPRSTAHLYQRCLAARRASVALHAGDQRLVGCPDGVLGWVRSSGAERRVVLVNFTGEPVGLDGTEALGLTSGWVVEVSSDRGGEGSPFTGRLGPDQAVWLRPI